MLTGNNIRKRVWFYENSLSPVLTYTYKEQEQKSSKAEEMYLC